MIRFKKSMSVLVLFNGVLTREFSPSRGVRQVSFEVFVSQVILTNILEFLCYMQEEKGDLSLSTRENPTSSKRCHTIPWNKFSFSKDVGGMDFRDLHLFNRTLIIKLGWGLITNPNALWVHCIILIMDLKFERNLCSQEEDGLLVMRGRSSLGGINPPSNEVEFCVRDYILVEKPWDIGKL
ncbi:hypothetical protein CR513_53359, partial [Mucuna pruriens]